MLKKVTITNYLGNSVEYIFQGASIDDQSGLLITEIEGLGPPKADINMTKLQLAMEAYTTLDELICVTSLLKASLPMPQLSKKLDS